MENDKIIWMRTIIEGCAPIFSEKVELLYYYSDSRQYAEKLVQFESNLIKSIFMSFLWKSLAILIFPEIIWT